MVPLPDLAHPPPRPAERRRRDAHRADRVADVVLAVAERALAVFPGLAPVDRREARAKGLCRGEWTPPASTPRARARIRAGAKACASSAARPARRRGHRGSRTRARAAPPRARG